MVHDAVPAGRVFIANRGEIALRIVRAAHALGLETVLGVSEADRDSPAAWEAGRTVVLGPPPSRHSYLNINRVIHAAIATGCSALHPGYGFLSERPELAEACANNGITFIGPTAESIRAVGDKLSAKRLAAMANVPMTRGSGKVADVGHALREAKKIGYPVITKASAGGGGRGMLIVRTPEELTAGFDQAAATAREAFGDDTLYIEAFVDRARHLEVQLVGDGKGAVTHFAERDCSVQRRYQKMIEEAPAAVLPTELRSRLHSAAVSLLSSVKYRNAGTVEFLYDVDRQQFYFMEVNSRIQVEHPVSEEITGIDLIALQIGLAIGCRSLPGQKEVHVRGHAIESRILAEDPARNFSPSPGRITRWVPPEGPGIRLDSAVVEGSTVPPFYDSMIAKLIVYGETRDQAVKRMVAALSRFDVDGIATNIPLLTAIATHRDFCDNNLSISWLETTLLPGFQAEKAHRSGAH
jgi:acetyl-CoA carboxylase biotin carboxylase subunit